MSVDYRLRRRCRVAVAVTALGMLLPAGAAAAATAQPAVTFTWHKLALTNGWKPGQTSFSGTGSPAWAVQNGVVYLSGSIVQPTGSKHEFAVLPVAARPARSLWISVYTLDGTQGFITIFANGGMFASSDNGEPFGNAQGYTSLAAVSFPARSMAMHRLTLLNGWVSAQSAFGSGDPAYSVVNGTVYLSGSLHQPSGTSPIFAVLPQAARPHIAIYRAVYSFGGTIGILEIFPNGDMKAFFEGVRSYTSLAAVSYPAASVTVHKLNLLNGWTTSAFIGTGSPSYVVSHGVVYLSGSLNQKKPGIDLFAVLPKSARPAHFLYIQVFVETPATVTQVGTLQIDPNGDVKVYSSPANNARTFSSLAGVSYPLGS